MRIDAHQHFWRYAPQDQPWIRPDMAALARDFLPEDFEPVLRGAGFSGSIAVQAAATVEETRWLLTLARKHEFLRGVLGWVDLCAPDVAEVLAELAADPYLVGIRHLVQDEADDRFVLREDFRHGMGQMQGLGLTYDLLLHPRHLPHAATLVAEFPDQKFVLDHLAKPAIKDDVREPWATDLARLAANPNVACKMSGLVTEADWSNWKPSDFSPFLLTAWKAFGPERLLFGSDWPVCLLAGDYDRVHDLLRRWAGWLDAGSQIDLFGGNATLWYPLPDPNLK